MGPAFVPGPKALSIWARHSASAASRGAQAAAYARTQAFATEVLIEQKFVELNLWPELVFRQRLHTIWLIRLRRRPLMKSDEMCPMAFTVIVILVAISTGGRIFDGIFFRKCLQRVLLKEGSASQTAQLKST